MTNLRSAFETKKEGSWKTFSDQVSNVLQKLDYQPGNRNFFQEALTYRGMGIENPAFERLEFLGDRVLKLIYGISIFERFPEADPELLTSTIQAEESNENLVKFATELDIGEFRTVFSRGQLSTDVLADTLEALVGAIYLDTDKNLNKTTQILSSVLKLEEVELSKKSIMTHIDSKSHLISLCQKNRLTPPTFDHDNIGTDNAPEFVATVKIRYNDQDYEAKGSATPKKKDAEKKACQAWLEKFSDIFT